MQNNAMETIKSYNMLKYGDFVIAGVSGGADSMALLHMLLNTGLGLKIHVVHINHMLRGDESDRDQLFVENYCKQNKIDITVLKIDIYAESKMLCVSMEEAGRLKRYEAFEKVRADTNASKIAVAHNQNDQTETVFMRLARGTGIKGLIGIPPVRDNVIRPLIHCSRQQIEKYCADNRIEYVTDGSNLMAVYTRNKLRLNFIPWIKQELNPKLDFAINNMTANLAADNDFLEICAAKEYSKCSRLEKNGGVLIDTYKVLQCHEAIRSRVIRMSIESVSKSLKDVSHTNITDILSLLQKQTGKKIMISNKIIVEKKYSHIHIYKRQNKTDKSFTPDFCYEIVLDKVLYISELKRYILATTDNNIFLDTNFLEESSAVNICTKTFDYDTIKGNIRVRNKKNGDTIHIKGVGNKKLSDYFVDMKIPKESRNNIPLLCDGEDNIFWVVDYRCVEKYMCSSTRHLVYITVWEENL